MWHRTSHESQLSQWFFSLCLFLSCCGIVGDHLPCSVSDCLAEISDFSEHWKVPTAGTSDFLSLRSTYGQSFASPSKNELRNALLHSRSGYLQIETLPSAALLPAALNTVYDKSLLILYCSQHLCEHMQWTPSEKKLKRKAARRKRWLLWKLRRQSSRSMNKVWSGWNCKIL